MTLPTATVVVAVAALAVLAVLGWAVTTYNSLVRRRAQVQASWAQIDVQLRRRHDLVPNLVETVKAYAAHERGTFEAVARARAGAVQAAQGADLAARTAAEQHLTHELARLAVVAEGYPRLTASANFSALQGELATTEDKIAYARQFYNAAAQTLTEAVQSVPSNLVAGLFGFTAPVFFAADDDSRSPVRVQF